MSKPARVFLLKFLYFILFLHRIELQASKLEVEICSESAILINADNSRVLFEKNADERRYPSSITKVATALYVLDTLEEHLDDMISVDQECIAWISQEAKRNHGFRYPAFWLEPGATHMCLKKGEQLSLRCLIDGLMLISANDAANVIAKYAGGSIPQFMEQLNSYLKTRGCNSTNFNNPHGLYHPNHWTTARDMARILQLAMQNGHFAQVVGQVKKMRPGTTKQDSFLMVQSNKLQCKGPYYYPFAIGGKTGYTANSGFTLVAAAQKGNRRLIAVLMKCPDRGGTFKDAKKLFEAAFNEPLIKKELVRQGVQPYKLQLDDGLTELSTYCEEGFTLSFYPSEAPRLRSMIRWQNLQLPIEEGKIVGEIAIKDDKEETIANIPLKAQREVKQTIWRRAIDYLRQSRGWSLPLTAGILIALSFFAWFLLIRR